VNRELKSVSVVVLLMFITLFVSSSVVQVVAVDSLRVDDRNVRTLYASFSAERGPILVDGEPIAESTPVDSNYSFQRSYPSGELYSAVTGYFTLNQGNTGIEGALNDELSGTSSSQFLDQLKSIVTGDSPRGAAVETTIDPDVQRVAWDALGNNSGAVVALDPTTGAILAMVSKTAFDPNSLAVHDTNEVIAAYNELESSASRPLLNRAIGGDLYPPGSVFKLVVTAAALESGDFTPDSTLPNPESLTLPLSSSVVTNSGGGSCGGGSTTTIANALQLSCNIPFAELGAALGEDRIASMAEKFGFGSSFQIPQTTTPSVYPRGLDEPTLMLSAFGQASVRVHPLQMAMVSGAIANGGVLMQPTLVDSILAPDLTVLQSLEPSVYSMPLSRQNAATLSAMMVNGVDNGVASNARISGVSVAGKTGTAENGPGRPFTLWFTGFAPADNPRVAVAVVVENNGGLSQGAFGNTVAAPIAKKVLEAVLNK
jgi:peptidoglycan glycosyltransferase